MRLIRLWEDVQSKNQFLKVKLPFFVSLASGAISDTTEGSSIFETIVSVDSIGVFSI